MKQANRACRRTLHQPSFWIATSFEDTMQRVSDIAAINISLQVNGESALFILLAEDGTVNRLGTGSAQNQEHDMFIGVTGEPIFSSLLSELTDEMLAYTGSYDIPDQHGAKCRLSIGLSFRDGSENGFGFAYGTDSQGPPREISRFVVSAVELTNPWYESQKQMVANTTGKPL
jgi:hypothetical protein